MRAVDARPGRERGGSPARSTAAGARRRMGRVSDLLQRVPDSHAALLRRPLVATLTTLDGGGRPSSTAVWFLLDEDGQLKSSVTSDRQKYRNLSGDPRCVLLVIDPDDQFRTIEVRADVELERDPDHAVVSRIARAYDADPAGFSGQDRVTITYRPVKVVVNPPA